MDFPETTERFIAFFDIMGFKDMIYREEHEEVSALMDKVADSLEFERDWGQFLISQGATTAVHPVFFSDSILFWSKSNSPDDAVFILDTASSFINSMFEKQIPVKGALAYGRFTSDSINSKYFGRPLVDAYLLSEEIHFYGAVLHHSFENHLLKNQKMTDEVTGFLRRDSIPLKKGDVTHYFVEWRLPFQEAEQWEPILQPFYMSVSGSTRKYVDNTFKVYGGKNPPK